MTLEIYIVPLHYRIDICNNSVVDIYLYLLRNSNIFCLVLRSSGVLFRVVWSGSLY